MRVGLVQLLVIFAIVVFFIGPTQIPKLAKALKNSKDELLEETSKKEETPDVGECADEEKQ